MNNQRQGSRTDRVRQNAHRLLDSDTIEVPLTPERAATAHFLEMGRAALGGKAVDAGRAQVQPDRHFQRWTRPVPMTPPSVLISESESDAPALLPEIVEETPKQLAQQACDNCEPRKARSKAHYRRLKRAAPPAAGAYSAPEDRDGDSAWLLDALRVYGEHDAQAKAERASVFLRHQGQGQRQPLPLMDLAKFWILPLAEQQARRTADSAEPGRAALASHASQTDTPQSVTPAPQSDPPASHCRTFQEVAADLARKKAEREAEAHRKAEEFRAALAARIPRSPAPEPALTPQEALRAVYAPNTVRVRVAVEREAEKLTRSLRPTVDEIAGPELDALRPTRGKGAGGEGAGKLFVLIHLLACYKADLAHLPVQLSQQTVHTSQELLAEALRCSTRTIERWTDQLTAAGLIEARVHYGNLTDQQTGEVHTAITGTLYSVRLQPGVTPRLTYGDLHHPHRLLDRDRRHGWTAHNYVHALKKSRQHDEKNMSGSTDTPATRGEVVQALQIWAVTPGGGGKIKLAPVISFDPDIIPETGLDAVQDVIYDLPLIAEEQDSRRRCLLVHRAAQSLAAAYDDRQSVAYYAGLIWQALGHEQEGRAGLQALAAQLARLVIDCREWENLRNPGALFVSRRRVRA